MIRDANFADLDGIRELFDRSNDSPYDIDLVAGEKCFGDGLAGFPRVRVFADGNTMRGVAVTCGEYLRILAVDRDHRRRGIGRDLLADSGARQIAAEPGNYFTPGVNDADEGLLEFFRGNGYRESAATWDMEADLTSLPATPTTEARRATARDRDRVLAFVEENFGAAWRFEAARAFDRDTPNVFWIKDTGFSVHDANNRGLGTFGPTGVIESKRGRGYGRQLLLASLHDLVALGYERAIIPWTDALNFYRQSCGAQTAHRFVTFKRQ